MSEEKGIFIPISLLDEFSAEEIDCLLRVKASLPLRPGSKAVTGSRARVLSLLSLFSRREIERQGDNRGDSGMGAVGTLPDVSKTSSVENKPKGLTKDISSSGRASLNNNKLTSPQEATRKQKFSKLNRSRATPELIHEPYQLRWSRFKTIIQQTHQDGVVLTLIQQTKEHLLKRAKRAEIDLRLTSEWEMEQVPAAEALLNLYYQKQPDYWVEVVRWFMEDEFWSGVILDVTGIRRNINRFLQAQMKGSKTTRSTKNIKIVGR